MPNGTSSITVDAGVNIRLRFFRLLRSVDATDEHVLICLRNIDRVWRLVILGGRCELDKSKSVGVFSGRVISSWLVTVDSISDGRSLGKIRVLILTVRQCEGFCFPINCSSLSKSTWRERGDDEESDGWIAGKTKYLLRVGEDRPGETEFSRGKKLFHDNFWCF